MGYKKSFEVKFIERTLEILNQYDTLFKDSEAKKYEDTLFLNACLGLLVVPQQDLFDRLPTEEISTQVCGLAREKIRINKNIDKNNKKVTIDDYSISNTARHLRNAVSHNHTVFSSRDGVNITHIELEDFIKEGEEITFKAKLTITEFGTFVLYIANYAKDLYAKDAKK